MSPVKSEFYQYEFDTNSLKEVRKALGVSQAALAELLDIPPNTLSRWESGATSPDARSLAAVYSLAMEKGYSPVFFSKKQGFEESGQKTRVLLAWDFQNLPLGTRYLKAEWAYMSRYINLLHPGARRNRTLRAYTDPDQAEAGKVLREIGFEVREGAFDADLQLVKDSRETCLKDPDKWVFILITDDGNYEKILREMRAEGVETYLWGSENCNGKLVDAANGGFINWDRPDVVVKCIEVARKLKGQPITRQQFARLCKEALDPEEVYPQDVGFSTKNPYGSLLRWLQTRNVLTVTPTGGRSGKIRIEVRE